MYNLPKTPFSVWSNPNMNIGKAYRSAQLCDLIGQRELSAEQQDVCETQMPLSTAKEVQIAGFFFQISHTLGLVLLWKSYIYTRNGSWSASIAHSMGTIGKYIDTKITLKKK